MEGSAAVPSDANFNFPRYEPYGIQRDLMAHLYRALSSSQITVVESPTGTGKTLSLLSSTLTWLHDAKAQARSSLVDSIRASLADAMVDEPEWVLEQEITRQVDGLEREERELEGRLEEVRRREEEVRRRGAGRAAKRLKTEHEVGGRVALDDEFAPDPYDSDDGGKGVEDSGVDNYTPEVRELMKKLAGAGASSRPEEEEPDVRKIYFASRTHSQLSQLIEELRKTPFAGQPPDATHLATPTETPPSLLERPIRVIPLGARQQLCINDEVKKQSGGSSEALNDACLELQKAGKEKRCKFLPPVSEPGKLNDFRDQALASVHTIGDIEDLGRKLHTCPYYGSRKAIRSAELVTLPYNLLMQKSAREALGVSLKDNVVVVDEAHNLIESILSLHTITISSSILHSLRSALVTYYAKFKTRFKGSNAAYLKQLLLVLKGLLEFADRWGKEGGEIKGKSKEAMMGVNEVVQSLKGGALDQVNLLKLDLYLKNSQISKKIGGYVDALAEEKTAKGRQALRSNATRNLHRLQSFLVSLVNPDRDGRILLSAERVPGVAASNGAAARPERIEVTIKYLLLAPSDSFRDIAEEARSVVLAGGTMAPISDFREQLFPYLAPERFSTFSCGHIVPTDHVGTYAISKGPTRVPLQFTFDKRKDEKLLEELGSSIVNICQLVPDGVVVFVPSYAFLDEMQARWQRSGMLERLKKKKKTFWEPKASSDVESTLREYAAANEGTLPGGVLFAVVGAKLSEGINFADSMARAVVVCGIPYPNAQSTELKERMSHMKASHRAVGNQDAGQVLYQNLAFRAVNQSIGRAIRHANDWAAIILLDARYTHASKQAQLPRWLGNNVESPTEFKGLIKSLSAFVRARKASVS